MDKDTKSILLRAVEPKRFTDVGGQDATEYPSPCLLFYDMVQQSGGSNRNFSVHHY